MKLKYPNEDPSSMEYMDTDVASSQEVIQKTHGNLFEAASLKTVQQKLEF